MPEPVIRKQDGLALRAANMSDYDAEHASFTWDAARGLLDGLPAGGLNIAYEAVDRHVAHGRGGETAFVCLGKNGERVSISYSELKLRSDRFASALRRLGVGAGETVYALAPRIPDLYVAALGTLKNRSVFCPLFSAFGPEPIETRLQRGDARVLLTTPRLFKRKHIDSIRTRVPGLKHVLLCGHGAGIEGAGIHELAKLMERSDPEFEIEPTDPEDPALLHFTSGTTGKPKGALHVHNAVLHHHVTGRYALDLHPEDVYWCTADPGWVTGTSYGIIAPLTNGVTSIIDEAEFEAERWYRVLAEERVDVWYTAPTAVRMLMKAGPEPIALLGSHRPRFIGSVGEPLNPEAIHWAVKHWDRPIHDNWWQSETGGIMIANYACMDIKPGSMGRPLPGVEAAIAERDEDGAVRLIAEPGAEGELVLRAGWPSMFRAYLNQEEKYRSCFADGWYFSGDLASCDADGYFHFVGRADDVIKSAGHLIGPFEVESALVEHEAVVEAAVIGKPDEVAGNIIKAFVVLRGEHGPEEVDEILRSVQAHARKKLGAAVAPKELEAVDHLPHTRSGKIMRRLLKARELGLPEGDTSTLEAPA